MAYWMDPTAAMVEGWATWLAERPLSIRNMALTYGFNPWKLYRLKSSGHRVTIYSFEEPEDDSQPTLKVTVSGQFNMVAFERQVFGVAADDLEECELPGANEPLGSAELTPDQVRSLIKNQKLVGKRLPN